MLSPNDQAPDFTLNDVLTGTPFTLSNHSNKVVCLAFVRYGFSQDRTLVQDMESLQNLLQNPTLQMVAVHCDPWLGDPSITTPTLTDNGWIGVLHYFESQGTPITFPTLHQAYDVPGGVWQDYQCGDIFTAPAQYCIISCAPASQPQTIRFAPQYGYDGYAALQNRIQTALSECAGTRNPVDIEMVMDVSGTMNNYAPGTNDTKLSVMKDAIMKILVWLGGNAHVQDRMGLIWFADNVNQFGGPNNHFFNLLNSSQILSGQISALTAGGCTAMGGGLQQAFNTLQAEGLPTQNPRVILLTDGMQNKYPMVNDVGLHLEITNSGNNWCGTGTSNVSPAPGMDIKNYNTRVHTIGVGITPSYVQLLSDIAKETDGFYKATYHPANDLDFIYFADLFDFMAGNSPTIVHHKAGNFYPEECQAIEWFQINKSIGKFTVFLSWRETMKGSLTFWLRAPDGSLFDLRNHMQVFETFSMADVYLPQDKSGTISQYVGTWNMIIRGETGGEVAPYHAIVVAEDDQIHFTFSYPKKSYEVGDIIPLSIRLEDAGKPLLCPTDLILEIAKLAVPLTKLLADYRLYKYPFRERMIVTSGKQPNMLELKLKALASDPQMQNQLLPVREEISLKAGTLNYQVTTKEIIIPVLLKDPGLHTFRVKVFFDTKKKGLIQRAGIVSVNVNPGKPEPKLSIVKVVPTLKDKIEGVMLCVTPRNSAGQLLGPGQSDQFKVYLGEKEIEFAKVDQLDGTYLFELLPKRKIKIKGKKVAIKFRDKLLWTGKI